VPNSRNRLVSAQSISRMYYSYLTNDSLLTT